MKRTLIVATTSYAGMGPYVSEIVNTFSPEDNIHYLFYEYEDSFFQKNVKGTLQNKCFYYRKNNTRWNRFVSLLISESEFYFLIEKICKELQIGLVHFICDPAPIRVAKKLEGRGIKVLGTVHDLNPHEAKKAPHRMLREKINNYRRRLATDYGKNLVTNGEAQFNQLKSMYAEKKLFFHSFPSLVSSEIEKGGEIPTELKGLDKPYILFFGRIEEYKGVNYLYKVFTETPELYNNYYLAIAGKGDLGFERIKNEKNVVWLHRYIKDTEVRYMYENAKCVVYPYISATQSGVLSIAFYFKTPTLASDVPFFVENIGKTGAGMLFKNGNVSDLKEKLLHILTIDTADMVNKERAYYDAFYQPAAIREKLLSIYNQVLTC